MSLVRLLRSVATLAVAVSCAVSAVGAVATPSLAAGAELHATGFSFDPVVPGSQRTGHVSVRNDGDAQSSFVSLSFTGTDAEDFSQKDNFPHWYLGANGGYGGYPVVFRPDSVGWKEATMHLVYAVDLGGGSQETATLDADIRALATSDPKGFIAEASDLGDVMQGVWASGTARISNDTELSVGITGVERVYGDPDESILEDRCSGVTLEPGDECTVDYRLRSTKLGHRTGWLLVDTDDPFLGGDVALPIDIIPNPVYPDDVRPVMTRLDQPVPASLDFSRATPRITLRMGWLASDERAVAGYQLQISRDLENTWTTLVDQLPPFSSPLEPVTTSKYAITPSLLYTRVRARDAAGNTSDWAREGTEYRFVDLAGATKTGTWKSISAKGVAYAGSLLQARKAGASASIKVNGRMLALIGRTSPDSGRLEIWVDGKKRKTIDLYSGTTKDHRVLAVFSGEIDRRHTVKVVVVENQGRTKAMLDTWLGGG